MYETLIFVNNFRRLAHGDSPCGSGSDVVGFGKAALIDGNGHAVQTIHIYQRLAHVYIREALGIHENVLVQGSRFILNADFHTLSVADAQL